jgi:hypothetical protein
MNELQDGRQEGFKWAGQVARMGTNRDERGDLMGKHENKALGGTKDKCVVI